MNKNIETTNFSARKIEIKVKNYEEQSKGERKVCALSSCDPRKLRFSVMVRGPEKREVGYLELARRYFSSRTAVIERRVS